MAYESQLTVKKDAYRAYLVIAFGITWLLWGISIAMNQSKGYVMPAPGNIITLIQNGFQNLEHIILSILFALANYGPLFGAIYAIRTEKGAKGRRIFGRISFLSKLRVCGYCAQSSYLF